MIKENGEGATEYGHEKNYAVAFAKRNLRLLWEWADKKIKKIRDRLTQCEAKDEELDGKISDEAQARSDADTGLDSKITSEAQARSRADTDLGSSISNEIRDRQQADAELSENITKETEERQQADAGLSENIAYEVQILADADAELNARITQEIGELGDSITKDINGKISAEEAARVRTDSELSNRIKGEAELRQSKDSQLEKGVTDVKAAFEAHEKIYGNMAQAGHVKLYSKSVYGVNTNRSGLDMVGENSSELRVNCRQDGGLSITGAGQLQISDNGIKKSMLEAELQSEIDKAATVNVDFERWTTEEASAREAADNELDLRIKNGGQTVKNLFFGITNELQKLYTAIGITHYDGGLFGMVLCGTPLDGGNFGDSGLIAVDFGSFMPITANLAAVNTLDGGIF